MRNIQIALILCLFLLGAGVSPALIAGATALYILRKDILNLIFDTKSSLVRAGRHINKSVRSISPNTMIDLIFIIAGIVIGFNVLIMFVTRFLEVGLLMTLSDILRPAVDFIKHAQ